MEQGALHTVNADAERLLAVKGTGPKKRLWSLYLSYKLSQRRLKTFILKPGSMGRPIKVVLCYVMKMNTKGRKNVEKNVLRPRH